jgi:F-type H+-transporting ATPase subunit epsilon
MASFSFELVSPERLLFTGQVEQVVVPGSEGDFAVLANHAPVMTTIRPGVISVQETPGGAAKRIFIRGGFADVSPSGLTILAEQAIAIEDLKPETLSNEVKAAEEDVADAKTPDTKSRAAERLAQLRELQKALSN